MKKKPPAPPLPTLTEREAAIPADVRHRVLVDAELRCARCGAEHDRMAVRSYFGWPDDRSWRPLVIGQKRSPLEEAEAHLVRVVVVAATWPWSGRYEDLSALCYGCALIRDVMALRQIVVRQGSLLRSVADVQEA